MCTSTVALLHLIFEANPDQGFRRAGPSLESWQARVLAQPIRGTRLQNTNPKNMILLEQVVPEIQSLVFDFAA